MHGLVDMVRLSPMGNETFAMLEAFRANENGAAPLDLTSNSDCNGYWKRLPWTGASGLINRSLC